MASNAFIFIHKTHQMKQKLTLYLIKKKQSNKQTNERKSLLHNTVCLQNNCCGFECMNGNLENQTHVQGVFEKYRDCMLCTNNTCNSDKSFVF